MNEEKNNILDKVPEGWTSYKLGEVITLVNGRAYGKEELLTSGKYKVIRIQNLNGGENWYYSNLELDENKYCHKGDLLFAWSTTFGPYYWNNEKAIFHYHIWNLILSDQIDKRFAYYYLSETTEELKKSSHGVAMLHITKSGMEGWHFPLPPLKEQKVIAAQLDNLFTHIDKAIQLVQENLEHINHLLPAALNDVFENLSSSSTSYKFDEFLKLSRGHNPPKSDFVYKPKDGYIRFIQIRDGSSDLNAVYVPFTNKLKLVSKEDLLIVAYRQVGKVFRGIEGAFNVALCKVTNKDKSRIDTDYIYYLIQSDFVKGELLRHSERALIPSMSVDHLAELKVPIPDITTQQKTVQYLERLSVQQQQLQKQYTQKLQQLKLLKASLLDAAFRGKLTQQTTNAKVIQLQSETLSLVAESEGVYKTSATLSIPEEKKAVARVVLAAKIISLHQADENWTRIKFQKLLYLAEYIIKADWEMKYFIQTAGPLDNHFLYDELQPALRKKKWFQEVDYRYYPLAKAQSVEKEYDQYFEPVDNRLSKLFKSFLKATEAQSEIAATLYAVWNNLLIRQEPVSNEKIIEGFYKWSERKEQYKQEQLVSALKWMRENDLVPEGFGKEIKKAKK